MAKKPKRTFREKIIGTTRTDGPAEKNPDPPIAGVEQQEIVIDAGHQPAQESLSENRPVTVDEEPLPVLNAGFTRLNTIESIAQKSAGVEGSEYDKNAVYSESDFTEVHGPGGVKSPSSPQPAHPVTPDAPTPGETTPPGAELPGSTQVQPDAQPEATPEVTPPATPTPAPAGNITITVDGQEETITMEEATRRLQIGGAAEKRMQDATEALNRVRALEERLTTPPQPGQPHLRVVDTPDGSAGQPAAGQHAGPGMSVPQEVVSAVDQIIEGLRYGDEDDARRSIFGLLQMGSSAGPAGNLSEAVRTEMDKAEIGRRFGLPPDQGGFQDIVADPDLYDLMTRRIDRAIAPTHQGGEGKNGLQWETYQEIGDEIRSKYLSGQQATTFQNKEQRKAEAEIVPPVANIPAVPGAGSATPPVENPNPSATVADMARSRRVG